MIAKQSRFSDLAVNGSMVSDMIVRAPTTVDPFLSGGEPTKVCVAFGGVGDGDSHTAAEIWTRLQTYCADRKAAGEMVVLCTEIDAQDAARNANDWHGTVYPSLNILIRASGTTVADAIVDLGADARLQDATNTTYFMADKLHPNEAGSVVISELVAAVVNALF